MNGLEIMTIINSYHNKNNHNKTKKPSGFFV